MIYLARAKIVYGLKSWRAYLSDSAPDTVIVLTNGCFDVLHLGHVKLLQAAKEAGTVLVVVVNSDHSVRLLKGPSRPIIPEDQRLAVVAALESVDYCFLFDEPRCDRIIQLVRPHVWVKGGNYTLNTLDAGERAAAGAVNAKIKIIPCVKGISTTKIIERCQK